MPGLLRPDAVSGLDPDVDEQLDELAAEMVSGIVAIDGPSGAGKSTVADALVAKLTARGTGVVLIRTDDFAEGAADDPMLVFDLTDQVRETIQQTLYRLLVARRSVFF